MEIKSFDDLRRRVGTIIGQSIPPKSFEQIAHKVDAEGRLAHKQMIQILVAMYSYLENNENKPL